MRNQFVLITLLFAVVFSVGLEAQTRSLAMDIRNDGVLVPKVTTAERKAYVNQLSNDESGLLVFDTNTLGFWLWSGKEWVAVKAENLSSNQPETFTPTTATTPTTIAPKPAPKSPYEGMSVKARLTAGQKPLEIVADGIPVSEIYGQEYQGGIIFYLDIYDDFPGIDGMVSTSSAIQGGTFGCKGKMAGTSDGINTGRANTEAIIANCTNSEAASIVRNFSVGKYDDWHLPSKAELQALLENLPILGSFWTSTEVDEENAYYAQSGESVNMLEGKKSALFALILGVRSF